MEIIAINGDICLRGKITGDTEDWEMKGFWLWHEETHRSQHMDHQPSGDSKWAFLHMFCTRYVPRSLSNHLWFSQQLYKRYYCFRLTDEETESPKVSINYPSSCWWKATEPRLELSRIKVFLNWDPYHCPVLLDNTSDNQIRSVSFSAPLPQPAAFWSVLGTIQRVLDGVWNVPWPAHFFPLFLLSGVCHCEWWLKNSSRLCQTDPSTREEHPVLKSQER